MPHLIAEKMDSFLCSCCCPDALGVKGVLGVPEGLLGSPSLINGPSLCEQVLLKHSWEA